MPKDIKIWLVGMTQNKINNLKRIVDYGNKYFDGLIYVDHFSTDGAYELLEENKKEGKIIQRPYYKQHSHSQNEILFCRHAKNGDWMFLNDSNEFIEQKWLNTIRNDILEYDKQGIGAVCFSGRVYLWKYFDNQQFYGSPHWSIQGIVGKTISFGEENKNQYIHNNRENNRLEHYVMHPIFYWYCHNPSNETMAVYSKYGQEVYKEAESIRQNFRLHCYANLGLSLDSLDDLISYMTKIKNKEVIPDKGFLEVMNFEFRLTELFQIKVLNMDLDTLVKNRYKFSIMDYLNGGTGFPEGYKGTILKLNEQFGIKEG